MNVEKNEKRKKEWEIFRDFFLISGNSGMRFGELRRIRWRDIRRMYKIKGEDQHPDGVVELYLPSNITKTGNDRTVVATAVPYFKRLKSLYDNPPPDQLIFANPRNLEEPCPPQFYYRLWDKMLEEAGHWGVPTMVFRGEPFFGQDRVDTLRWRLDQCGLGKN